MERLARVRADLEQSGLDAFVVSHPPNVRYLTGLNASAGAVIVLRATALLVVDFRYLEVARRAVTALSASEVLVSEKSIDDTVAAALQRAGVRRVGIEAAYLTVARFNRLTRLLTASRDGAVGPELIATERIVERHRAVKDAGEIATLRTAAQRLSAVAREARSFAVAGATERQVAAAIDSAMRAAGFERPAFETIVASGPNSALPHARPTSRRLAEGEGVVLDFGGIYDGYCVDLTRTLHVGPVSAPFRRLFDAVAAAHAAALAAVKPGALAVDIDAAARGVLVQHGLGEAFGHGTGHGLGLEVHEEPRISPHAPAAEPVLEGMVFTIEPGAYVSDIGGVRIEDDVLVAENGAELLTDVPIEL